MPRERRRAHCYQCDRSLFVPATRVADICCPTCIADNTAEFSRILSTIVDPVFHWVEFLVPFCPIDADSSDDDSIEVAINFTSGAAIAACAAPVANADVIEFSLSSAVQHFDIGSAVTCVRSLVSSTCDLKPEKTEYTQRWADIEDAYDDFLLPHIDTAIESSTLPRPPEIDTAIESSTLPRPPEMQKTESSLLPRPPEIESKNVHEPLRQRYQQQQQQHQQPPQPQKPQQQPQHKHQQQLQHQQTPQPQQQQHLPLVRHKTEEERLPFERSSDCDCAFTVVTVLVKPIVHSQ
jgi:hypothetical protein